MAASTTSTTVPIVLSLELGDFGRPVVEDVAKEDEAKEDEELLVKELEAEDFQVEDGGFVAVECLERVEDR